jgi:hypothetical protein
MTTKEEALMVRSSSMVIAIVIVAGSGTIHAFMTDRWVLSAEPAASAAKLAGVARVLGDWEATKDTDLELTCQAQERAGIAGYLARRYENRETKSQVYIFLVCGRPGPISVHSPENCLPGVGFREIGLAALCPEGGDNFWGANFVKEDPAIPDRVRVLWAWNADGRWRAPKNPRLAFARHRALFKLYVLHQLPDLGEPLDQGPSRDLMALLLPELQRCLFPES